MNTKKVPLALLSAALLVACGEQGTTENITQINQMGMDVVASVDELPECTKDNEGEQAFVKGETSARVCVDEKWFATKESVSDTVVIAGGKDTVLVSSIDTVVVAGDTVLVSKTDTLFVESGDMSCTTEPLADSSGLKIVCNGDSIGVVLNGAKGDTGAAGKDGEPGAAGKDGVGKDGSDGKDGAGCSLSQQGQTLFITCGEKTASLKLGEDGGVVVDTAALDSEKVAISLDEVTGVTQKGPFLSGSKVLVREMSDGRTLTQTGNSFNGKILNDKGEFKINARMLVSQYVMLEATGYYRNEVTGDNSNSELTLFAITDVNDRNIVNVNLLTHLEYERVVYLVTKKKMRVKAAKKQAQQEIFGLLGIDAEGFSNSEDLNIAGSSDEDGALLAFSVMFQGNRTVAQLTELLTQIATDMEEDGTWDNSTAKMGIAEWAADADSSGQLAQIRNNVEGWGLSSMVPKFEPFVRHFWYTQYGLGDCSANRLNEVAAATAGKRNGTKTRYICKEIGDATGDYRWVIASDFEKDTDGWNKDTTDGVIKVGSVTGTRYYLYDGVAKEWLEASVVEQVKSGCIESVAADPKKNTGFVNGYWYKCENREWVRTTAYIVDTQGWVAGSDGDIQKGDSTDTYYVFDLAENKWRDASENDVKLNLMGCTTNRAGEMGRSSYDNRYYGCSTSHQWEQIQGKADYNTLDFDCDEEGKMVYGAVDKETYFVCDAGVWREATTGEEQVGAACTAALNGRFNKDSTWICENKTFREANLYDFDVGVKNWFNPNVEYGTLLDDRDGRTYKTVTINGYTVMAENLNYAGKPTDSYLIGQNWCYKNDTTNCIKGGRYYTWTAAMNIDSKWQNDSPYKVEGLIKSPHQGICPDGWHIPTSSEWSTLFSRIGFAAQQSVGHVGWTSASNESGFSALPVGGYGWGDFRMGSYIYFWSTTEILERAGSGYADVWMIDAGKASLSYPYNIVKGSGYSVRCFKD